ncbi:MAG: hypothetical protein VX766_03050 [Pseudomonadota bacterium]|nr:hypothetical protein [Pseudomonadota bacterium]
MKASEAALRTDGTLCDPAVFVPRADSINETRALRRGFTTEVHEQVLRPAIHD